MTMRSARIACLRASADHSSVDTTADRVDGREHHLDEALSPRARGRSRTSAGSVPDRRGLEVSISTRSNGGSAPRSRSITRWRNVTCRSERVMQQTQPLPSSATSSVVPRTSASSMPTAPYSLMMTAVARALRRREEAPHQRGLAGAQEARDDRDRHARAARALLPPPERDRGRAMGRDRAWSSGEAQTVRGP